MAENPKISIWGLFKIFGPDPAAALKQLRPDMSKTELNERYGHVLALRDINLKIPAGRIFVIMGLSGSGKSTLIRHMNRIIEPTAGEVEIDGRDILDFNPAQLRGLRRTKMAMVFQRFALLPHKTALDNIAYGLTIQGHSIRKARARAGEWLERVGITGFETSYPAQLSGGMQQRVGLARALATNPEILLMDEAFSALDPLIRTDMRKMLLKLQADLGKTIVFITHDLEEALSLGDRIAILRDGELVQEADPQSLVLKPANEHVADFVKDINRGKVVKLRTVMSALNGEPPGLLLAHDTLLEEALAEMTRQKTDSAGVINAKGKMIGRVTMRKLAQVISAPALRATD